MTDPDEIVAVDRDNGRAYIPADTLGRVVDALEDQDARITDHGALIDDHAERLARLEAARPWWVRLWRKVAR